jgi:mono/diheme cytochrome c family protein
VHQALWSVLVAVALARLVGAQSASDPDAVSRGAKLYTAQKCAVCHSIGGKGNAKGPLDNVGAKLTPDEIRQWLIAPRTMAEKTKSTRKPPMPDYTKLSKEELDALVAYMSSLKTR